MNWDIVVTAAISAAVPSFLVWVLNRKRYDKKFDLDKETAEASIFDSVSGRLNELLRDADQRYRDQGVELESIKTKLTTAEGTIRELTRWKESQEHRLHDLHDLFIRVMARLKAAWGVESAWPGLTPEEQRILDQTRPTRK